VRSNSCDIIYGHYLEPYAVAAHLASHWCGVPYVLKHAGSDLFRLAQIPTLRTTYVEVLKGARRVISQGLGVAELTAMGVAPARIVSDTGSGVPTAYFHPGVEPLSGDEFVVPSQGPDDPLGAPLDQPWPILGIYGKIGGGKGSFDLLEAIAELTRAGFPLYLVAMAHGRQEGRFRKAVCDLGLEQYVRIRPFLPNWRVAAFLRRCTAVAMLEHDFEIAAHMPVSPREVVACGVCLIVSEEIARKQPFRAQIQNGRNAVVVRTPRDHSVLAESVRYALEDRGRAIRIGMQGHRDLSLGVRHEEAIQALESLLTRVAHSDPLEVPPPQADLFHQMFPLTSALLDSSQREVLDKAIALRPGRGLNAAELANLVRECFAGAPSASLVSEVCRYEEKVEVWRARRSDVRISEGHAPCVRGGWSVNEVPRFACDFEIAAFAFDVSAATTWLKATGRGRPPLSGATRVLFSSCSSPVIVGNKILALLKLIEKGTLAIRELHQSLTGTAGGGAGMDAGGLLPVIERFYWMGLVTLHA
jgi:glycosyltransferase involved in cell wall biosynthesis